MGTSTGSVECDAEAGDFFSTFLFHLHYRNLADTRMQSIVKGMQHFKKVKFIDSELHKGRVGQGCSTLTIPVTMELPLRGN